jgi:5'-nucleotidase
MTAKPFVERYWKAIAVQLIGIVIAAALVTVLIGYPVGDNPFTGKTATRHLTFIAVNDIYRIDGVGNGAAGGLTRVRTLRRWIERDAPNAILLHAGDFLAPSLASKVFKGEHMIEAMNGLDGDDKAFDERMFVAFGNHEFDDSRCTQSPAPLIARVAASQFRWLGVNLDVSRCESMKTLFDQKQVVRDGVVLDVNGVKLGLFGIALTPDKNGAPKFPDYENEIVAARRALKALRARGAEFVLALTHLPREDDEALLRELAPEGLDFIAGGHDHNSMVLHDRDGAVRGVKADSDARSAWRIDIDVPAQGKPAIRAQLIALNEAIPPDAALETIAQNWNAKTDVRICADLKPSQPPGCLAVKVGTTQTVIELEETANRMKETGFGDWLADLIRERAGADFAFINSGSLGLGEDVLPGTPLLRRHIADIFRYDSVIAVRSVKVKALCEGLRKGFNVPGQGAWPHISGARVEIRRVPGQPAAVTVLGFAAHADLTCGSDASLTVATVPFMLCANDGYPLMADDTIGPGQSCESALAANPWNETGDFRRLPLLLSGMTEAAIREAGDAGIRPETDGRVHIIEGAK